MALFGITSMACNWVKEMVTASHRTINHKNDRNHVIFNSEQDLYSRDLSRS